MASQQPAELTLLNDTRRIHIFQTVLFLVQAIQHSISLVEVIELDEDRPTLHRQIKAVYHELGLLNLHPLTDINCFNNYPHPIHVIIASQPANSGFRLCVRSLHRFYERFRVSISEFCVLYEDLLPLIDKPMKSNSEHARIARRSLSPADMLAVFLLRSDNEDAELISIIFNDVHRTTLDRSADHVTDCINELYGSLLDWPDQEERQLGYDQFSSYSKAVGIIDGTHCQISVPLYAEYEHYSGYKGYHTQNYLIICDFFGLFIYVSDAFYGRDNDRAAFNQSAFVTTVCPLLSSDETLLGDGGFRGPGHLLDQFTAQELVDATAGERERMISWNQEFDLNRALIEHSIHRLKNRAQALSKRDPRDLERQPALVRAAAALCNQVRLIRLKQRSNPEIHMC